MKDIKLMLKSNEVIHIAQKTLVHLSMSGLVKVDIGYSPVG
jgi:hypothetical protein